jgi:hypothetical protein
VSEKISAFGPAATIQNIRFPLATHYGNSNIRKPICHSKYTKGYKGIAYPSTTHPPQFDWGKKLSHSNLKQYKMEGDTGKHTHLDF